jgi:hypothetical protein
MALPQPTRRWPRFAVDLPVQVVPISPKAQVAIAGLVTEISQGGMSIYAGLSAEPGEIIEIVFQTPQVRLTAVIRSRDGFCYGLEFLALRKPAQRASTGLAASGGVTNTAVERVPEADRRAIEEAAQDQSVAVFLRRHYEFLRRNQQEARRFQSELASVRAATFLLEKEGKHPKFYLHGRHPNHGPKT